MRHAFKVLDWKFLLALAFLILSGQVGFSSYATTRDNHDLIATVQQGQRLAKADRAKASKERQMLLDTQEQLKDNYTQLLSYLDAAGVVVPDTLTNGLRLPSTSPSARITVRPKVSGGGSSSGSKSCTNSGTSNGSTGGGGASTSGDSKSVGRH